MHTCAIAAQESSRMWLTDLTEEKQAACCKFFDRKPTGWHKLAQGVLMISILSRANPCMAHQVTHVFSTSLLSAVLFQ